MASCKDCICEKVCRYNDGVNQYCKGSFGCPYFKDRSKFVELPSATVPIKIYLSGDVDKNFVLRDYCFDNDQNIFYMIIQCIETQEYFKRDLNEYGRTVFLTREEAEKALKEREQK